MGQYVLRRLLLMIPTVFLALVIVFGMIRLIPGDALVMLLSEQKITETQSLDELRAKLGFDQPLHMQFLHYLRKVAAESWGESFFTKHPVLPQLLSRLPITLEIALIAIVVSVALSIPIGVISALRQDSWTDYLLRVFAIGGVSIPDFWIATLFIVFPAIWFYYSPPIFWVTWQEDPFGHLQIVLPPALILGVRLSAYVMRMTRSVMLEVLRQDYIRTAWAKGLRERVVVYRHAVKNALIPIVTMLGLQITFLMGGTVVMEQIFNIPGMGRFLLDAVRFRDYEVVQGVNLFLASFIVVMNFLIDLSYAYLDPRIRYS